jgi:dipeptidyl aminopeptidase/acylaminoacyl peptidase
MMPLWLKWAAFISVLCLLANVAVIAVLTAAALHPPRMRRASDVALHARNIEQATGATAALVSITAQDGTLLKAWWLIPPGGASRAVIVCHGVGDSAMGSLGFSPFLLRHGFAVLVPDSRGHGESGGFVTYGVRESDDILHWLQWTKTQGISNVCGLGESLGGAILLQSLQRGAGFQALIAESSYATFQEVADDRTAQIVGPFWARILVREAMLYTRLRYRVNLWNAQPAKAVAHSHVPILLIHGVDDKETLPKHSQEIASANPAIQLWLVPHAVHTGAYAATPIEFESRVAGWFHR